MKGLLAAFMLALVATGAPVSAASDDGCTFSRPCFPASQGTTVPGLDMPLILLAQVLFLIAFAWVLIVGYNSFLDWLRGD